MNPQNTISELQYPIGKFQPRDAYTIEQTQQSIENLEKLPALFIHISDQIKNKLDQTYREGGWNALQVINHLVDVYLNAYLRTKWLLSEKNATLKPYDQEAFALMDNGLYNDDVDTTLQLVKLLIERFIKLLQSLPEERFNESIYHPEYNITYSLHRLVAMYDWHGYHHLAHLQIIKNKN